MYVIGIDIGTSGTKTVLFDQVGNTVASATREYPLYQPKNGWAEQDPADWWQAAVETLREVTAGVNPSEILGIGLSGQMHGLVMLDKENRVLRPAILWCDSRTGPQCAEIEERVGHDRLMAITANPALPGFTASKLLWVREHQPEIWAACAHILLPKDYIRLMLTGVYATDVSDASGMQLLDIPNRCWSREVCEKLEIDMSWLAQVVESPSVTGKVTESAAALTGLAAGTPVVGGAGDNAAAAVGMGVVTPGRAFTTIGTSGVVFLHSDEVTIDPKGRVHTFCCAVPGKWHMMGVTQGAGLSLRWLRDQCCDGLADGDTDPYILMDRLAETSPIGANRLLFLPYLMGERTPHLDPAARGGFIGLSGMHQKADLIRAVLEGVSYSLKDCLEVFREMGQTPDRMLCCGGGGKSPLWRQMLAEVFGCPVSTAGSDEGPALGAGILAMVGAGLYPTVEEACAAVAKEGVTCTPDPANSAEYEKFYRLYDSLYPVLKETFAALAAL